MDSQPSLAETREQFLDRLSMIGFRPGDTIKRGDWLAVKEAVYAQALRDVLDLMQEREIVAGSFALTLPIITDDDLMAFAAERGIDLEDK